MYYSIERKDRIYVKGCWFVSFAKCIGKNVNTKYSQKLFDKAKKHTTDAIKSASKKTIQKAAAATGDLIDNEISDKITKASSQNSLNTAKAENTELNKGIPEEKYVSIKIISINISLLRLIKQYNNIITEYQKITNLLDDQTA